MDGETALFGDTSLAGCNAQVAQVTSTYRDRNQKKKSCTAPGSKGESPTQIKKSLTLKPQPSHRPTFMQVNQGKTFLFSFTFFFFLQFYASSFTVDIHTLTMSCHFFRPAIFTGQKSKVRSQSRPRVLLLVSGLRAQCHLFVVQGICSLSSEVHGAVSPVSPSNSRAHRSFDVGPSLLMAATAFIATFPFCHPSTSAPPSIRHSILDSHLQHEQTLHMEPAGSSHRTCQALCGEAAGSASSAPPGGPNCSRKECCDDQEQVLCRVLDSVLRSLLNGRVSRLTGTHKNARCPQRSATTTSPPTDAHAPLLPNAPWRS